MSPGRSTRALPALVATEEHTGLIAVQEEDGRADRIGDVAQRQLSKTGIESGAIGGTS
jgi:hypothetical protein